MMKRYDLVKYLLDQGVDPMLEATDRIKIYVDVSSSMSTFENYQYKGHQEPGKKPLEIAIENEDSEMVRLLLFHNPENAVSPEDYTKRVTPSKVSKWNNCYYSQQCWGKIAWYNAWPLDLASSNEEIIRTRVFRLSCRKSASLGCNHMVLKLL